MGKMDRCELVSVHTSRPEPWDPSAAALGADGRPRQILIPSDGVDHVRKGKGLIAARVRPHDWAGEVCAATAIDNVLYI